MFAQSERMTATLSTPPVSTSDPDSITACATSDGKEMDAHALILTSASATRARTGESARSPRVHQANFQRALSALQVSQMILVHRPMLSAVSVQQAGQTESAIQTGAQAVTRSWQNTLTCATLQQEASVTWTSTSVCRDLARTVPPALTLRWRASQWTATRVLAKRDLPAASATTGCVCRPTASSAQSRQLLRRTRLTETVAST